MKAYFFSIVFIFTAQSHAAQVLKVKKNQVLINTEGESIETGQLYFLINKNGKKKGLIKIRKAKNQKAIGRLLKGRANKSWTLRLRRKKKTQSFVESTPKLKPISKRREKKNKQSHQKDKIDFGFAIGYNSNSSDVEFLDANNQFDRSDSYAGTSLSYGLTADLKLRSRWSVRGFLGLHNFSTGDDNNTQCTDKNNQSATCKIDISYINLDTWLRHHFTQGKYNLWAGGGVRVLLSPSSSGTTALDESNLGMEVLPIVGGGMDYKLNERFSIPLWGQYAYYIPTHTVAGSTLSLFVGLTYRR